MRKNQINEVRQDVALLSIFFSCLYMFSFSLNANKATFIGIG
jgi:hypothetical protein